MSHENLSYKITDMRSPIFGKIYILNMSYITYKEGLIEVLIEVLL